MKSEKDSELFASESDETGDGRSIEAFLGKVVKEHRTNQGLTIADLAEQSGLSRSMVSKIENGQVSTSLDSIVSLARALGISISTLFKNFEHRQGNAQHVKSGTGMEVVRRGTTKGHTYHLLAYDQGPVKLFEPFLITLDDEAEVFPTFEHPGTEFIYMLQGKMEYRHGNRSYLLQPGDALTFQGSVAHGPERLIKLPIRFITVIMYGHSPDASE
ncbi:helix-turn-helix domain-containing protein [Paraburkholderia sp. JPY432]|uniref:helix-turn-helix domain-containing protein n=1 Tax=Paraburkholderia TaxID=1822464 RepID=UPI001595D689|nr:XRE family transcriptional regulator [Paraburkholderia youngii]NVH76997.1 helix-turn-helix domain-containing protein [Paraburkholderia youngii]